MTCKDCIHYDMCDFWVVEENINIPCETVYNKNRFLDKSKFVEVVRCKDCKHWLKDVVGCTEFVGYCERANWTVGATGFCVYWSRRA